ncbi:MAG: penicillin-binding protein 1A, partial [bacterium]
LYQLPQVEQLEEYFPPVSTLVYSLDNSLIAQFYQQQRVFIPLTEIPRHLIKAFLAVEDANFYSHHGIEPKAIFRAFYVNFKAGRIQEGGSTITQQLAKVLFLTPERSWARKIREAILAIRIERKYTKDEILELYLNQIYLGNGAYGVESAARTIFGRSVKELNLTESALIAGLPSSPNRYSPHHNLALSLKRRDHVLQRMLDEKYISKEQYVSTFSMPLRIVHSTEKTIAPYYLEHVRRYLEEQYGPNLLYKGGLQVFTTLDTQMQKAGEEAVVKGLQKMDLRRGTIQDYGKLEAGNQMTQGALIAIDPGNGYIKAMIGGRDFEVSQFNRATQARRQPGSAMKPLIYTAAVESGCTAADIFIDSPFIMHNGRGREKAWSPENFSRRFCGPVTLRTALERSINVVAVKLLNKIGIDTAISYALRMGIKSPLAPYLSLALGTSEVSLMELTSAYGVLANEGVYVEPVFIRRVMDREGRRVLEDNFIRSERVVSPETAYILTSMLQGVIQRGTGQLAKVLPYRLAGKTGTTDHCADAWFIGYCPDLVAGVWVGLDNNESLGEGETGGRAACPIWISFMDKVLSSWDQVSDFRIPDGLSFVFIDPETGLLAGENSYDKFLEVFKNGSEPRLYSKQKKGSKFKENDFYLNFIE